MLPSELSRVATDPSVTVFLVFYLLSFDFKDKFYRL